MEVLYIMSAGVRVSLFEKVGCGPLVTADLHRMPRTSKPSYLIQHFYGRHVRVCSKTDTASKGPVRVLMRGSTPLPSTTLPLLAKPVGGPSKLVEVV